MEDVNSKIFRVTSAGSFPSITGPPRRCRGGPGDVGGLREQRPPPLALLYNHSDTYTA